MRWSIKLLLVAATLARAGPVDFGMTEFNAALAARNLKWRLKPELSLDPPETYRIEPLKAGGARISGGDLRGLMYALLEAAEQIRATGRLSLSRGVPTAPVRAIRIFFHGTDAERAWVDSTSFWRGAFQMMARDRLNRVNFIFTAAAPELSPPYNTLRSISQTAADYGVDFALGIWDEQVLGPDSHEALTQLIAACPMIRSVQLRASSDSAISSDVFKALHEAGRRVTLDPRGEILQPTVLKAAQDAGVALLRSPLPWPPGFEIDPPLDGGRWEPARYPLLYWLWGRFGYDPKTKLPKGADPEEYRAAIDARNQLAIARLDVTPGDWGFVATIAEAVHNRLERIASAKQTPLQTADLLEASAARLERSAIADFQLIGSEAREQAMKLRAAYDDELSLKGAGGEVPPLATPLPRPQFEHRPGATAPPNQLLDLTLHITTPKDVRSVRIHYRTLADFKTIDKPAAAAVTFTIPASDIAAEGELIYYFEILEREGGGWFEPDPFGVKPFYTVRIVTSNPLPSSAPQ